MLLLSSIDFWLPWLGVIVCVVVCLQFMFWTTGSLLRIGQQHRQFKLSQQLLIEQIANEKRRQTLVETEGTEWRGYRKFTVTRLAQESKTSMSVYLEPQDNKSIPSFLPGQHLTFQWSIPGQSKPIIRCYSLSDSPKPGQYRITVKQSLPPRENPELPSGVVSTYINERLSAGDVVDVKAPGGNFYLDVEKSTPVVCLAGGVGITPLFAMIRWITEHQPNRTVILLYGVCSGEDHIFKDELNVLADQCDNVHVVNCYSDPRPVDTPKNDYHVHGRVSIDIIKQVLPDRNVDFYMCGPPPFMNSIYQGLLDWGVPESLIHYEAFGPATIKKTKSATGSIEENKNNPGSLVKFSESGKSIKWQSHYESILEAADENEIEIESGCRAGSCGTCMTKLLSGNVKYSLDDPSCEPGHCLPCISTPDGEIELDA